MLPKRRTFQLTKEVDVTTNSRRRRWGIALALATGAGALVAAPAAADSDDSPPPTLEELAAGRYVVVLDEEPLVTEFGREGVNSASARARGVELTADQIAVAEAAGLDSSDITQSYTAALNGFAAKLNTAQLAKVSSDGNVMMVLPEQVRYPQTNDSLEFLELDTQGGAHRAGLTGEGVVVGVIDSGIWPEHPSLADDGSYPDLGIALDESTFPACDFGNTAHNAADAPFECNNKLLGARQTIPTYRAVIGAEDFEFDSARDDDGHGTHTATTAAGNAEVEAIVFDKKIGQVTGVAPRARVIAYKGLGTLGGFGSDLAASIDQAVLDGVDVINYSIGGGASAELGPDDVAFLFAAAAGVRVATSAGNSGPGEETVGGPAHLPWITTVGASTQPRFFQGRVRPIGGPQITGASLTEGTGGRFPLVDAEDAGDDLCNPGALDPAVVDGNIVLCRRGAIARAAKSEAVAIAGGVGMILYNNSDDGNLFTDNHFVPSVHVNLTDGLKMKDYIDAKSNPRVSITTGEKATNDSAPAMTIFSSRGANPSFSDLIKPDVTAPGHQILAGASPVVAPGGTQGQLFQSISGTSMSSPHVAGLFALLAQAHPDWSAAATKSALMTTAHQDVLDNDRVTAADPFEMGAGHVAPGKPRRKNSMFKPGLVYDADLFDYAAFTCGNANTVFNQGSCDFLEAIGVPSDASQFNVASIGIGELAGSETITRTVTSVDENKPPIVYTPVIEAPEGYTVTVMPETIRIRSGESATYQVTISNVDAPVGEWRHGSLTWEGGNYEVRSPISVRGVSIGTPAAVSGDGVDGDASVPISFGYTGDYSAAAHGLEAAIVIEDTVVQDPDQNFDPNDGFSNSYTIETSGDAFLRIALPPESVNDPNIDLDMFIFGPDGTQIASSTAGGTAEQVDFVLPEDGTYTVWIQGWQTVEASADFTMYVWLISATPGGNMSVDSAPASAVVATEGSVDVSWTGATAGEWHLGAVSHADADGLLALTLVDVDNRALGAEPE